ncbi:MAG: hypothetical protein KGI37_09775 [Alphaproteobacteria bacterium]|nr:hypothetical protein [Alphaproteobacteria bacterium]
MSDSEFPPETGPAETVATPPLLGPSWQEQDGLLRDMWLQNKTPQEISAVLGRSVAAIMTRAARLGLPRRAAPGRKPGRSRMNMGAGQEGGATISNGPAAGSGQNRAARQAAPAENAAPQASARICLMCLRSFQSMGRHNRICPSCKGSSEYASAASMADIHFPV